MKMRVVTTTLRQIRQHEPCADGWRTLLSSLGKTGADDEPLPLTTILRSNGLDDALWCLRTITGYDREITRFVLACVQEVSHLMTDKRSLDVLSALERHLEIPLSKRELDQVVAEAEVVAEAALAAARAVGVTEAAWAAWVTVAAAWAVARAAWAAARAAGVPVVAARAAAEAAQAAAWVPGAAARAARAAEAARAEAVEAEAVEAAWAAARARQVQIFEEVFG